MADKAPGKAPDAAAADGSSEENPWARRSFAIKRRPRQQPKQEADGSLSVVRFRRRWPCAVNIGIIHLGLHVRMHRCYCVPRSLRNAALCLVSRLSVRPKTSSTRPSAMTSSLPTSGVFSSMCVPSRAWLCSWMQACASLTDILTTELTARLRGGIVQRSRSHAEHQAQVRADVSARIESVKSLFGFGSQQDDE